PGQRADSARAFHLRQAIRALRRALEVATDEDSARDVADAKAMLAFAYLLNNDPYSAATISEQLARGYGADVRAAEFAVYALQAYARIVADDRARQASTDEIQTDLRRLQSVAEYMEATWPTDPATDSARHQLGLIFFEDHSFSDACEMLARIDDKYPNIGLARYQLGIAAQQFIQKDARAPAELGQKVIASVLTRLEQLPPLPPGADPESAFYWFQAKL